MVTFMRLLIVVNYTKYLKNKNFTIFAAEKIQNMKKILMAAAFAAFGFIGAQTSAFNGQGDTRFQIGANFQDGGTGIMTSLDYGLGDSFSIGAQAGYLLGYDEIAGFGKPDFGDRFDIKARFNAHLVKVIGLPSNFDLYPGLNLGLKNFGGHVGAKYYFSEGFGLFAEAQFPFAKYNDNDKIYRNLNNQFAFNVGVSFDLGRN